MFKSVGLSRKILYFTLKNIINFPKIKHFPLYWIPKQELDLIIGFAQVLYNEHIFSYKISFDTILEP